MTTKTIGYGMIVFSVVMAGFGFAGFATAADFCLGAATTGQAIAGGVFAVIGMGGAMLNIHNVSEIITDLRDLRDDE